MTPRIFNALIGIWLFLAAFAWPQTTVGYAYTAVAGVLTVLFALLSGRFGWARYANLAVGFLLLVLTLALSYGTAVFWNNSIAGAAIVLASLMDRGPEEVRRERDLYGRVEA
jgi:threonine/homoserine efflux transporter RhtA